MLGDNILLKNDASVNFPVNALVVPDSFKNCLSANQVSKAIIEGIKKNKTIKNHKITTLPFSDGGEGALETIKKNYQAKTVYRKIVHPLLRDEKKYFKGKLAINRKKKLVIIESAKLCGLELIPFKERNPYYTTTYPLGEVMKHYINQGYKNIIITLGGSATNDGGLGMLQAMGAKITFETNQIATEPVRVVDFLTIKKIDLTKAMHKTKKTNLIVLTDVENKLLGKGGCSFIFGPQKFSNSKEVNLVDLENRLKHLVKQINKTHDEFKRISVMNRTGAAGGLGYSFALLGATLHSGFEYLSKIHQLKQKIASNQIIFTGEGCFDEQSHMGKIVGEMIKLVIKNQTKKKLFVLAGKIKKPIKKNPAISLIEINGNDFAGKKNDETILDPKANYEAIIEKVSAIEFDKI